MVDDDVRSAAFDRHVKSVKNQLRFHIRTRRVADDTAAKCVEHDGEK